VLSALRFGRTGSNPNDIILKKKDKKKDLHTKSLLWKKYFKEQDLVLHYSCRATLMSVIWLKKHADNENVIIYSPPHVIPTLFCHPSGSHFEKQVVC